MSQQIPQRTVLETYANAQSVWGQGSTFDEPVDIDDAFTNLKTPDYQVDNLYYRTLQDTSERFFPTDRYELSYYDESRKYQSIGEVKLNDKKIKNPQMEDFDIIWHSKVVESARVALKNSQMNISAILLGNNTSTLAFQIPLEPIQILDDEILTSIVVYSNLLPTKGAGVILWNMPLRCVNQLPVAQLGNKGKTNFGDKRFSRVDIIKHIERIVPFGKVAREQTRNIFNTLTTVQLNPKELDRLVYKTYPNPDMPKRYITDSHKDYLEREREWVKSLEDVKENRAELMHVIENGTKTADNKATRDVTLYSYVQAASQIASRHGYRTEESWFNQFTSNGGSRRNEINRALQISFGELGLKGFRIDSNAPEAVKTRVKNDKIRKKLGY